MNCKYPCFMKICITGCIRIEAYDVPLLFKICFNSERVAEYFESVNVY